MAKPNAFNISKAILPFSLGFAWKTNNNISSNIDMGYLRASIGNNLSKLLRCYNYREQPVIRKSNF
jgi:hypothetical protein